VKKKLELGWVARAGAAGQGQINPDQVTPCSVGVLAASRNNRIAMASRIYEKRSALLQLDLTSL